MSKSSAENFPFRKPSWFQASELFLVRHILTLCGSSLSHMMSMRSFGISRTRNGPQLVLSSVVERELIYLIISFACWWASLSRHVARTGDIKQFIITEESGIAKGIRRIVAVTGHDAAEAQRVADVLTSRLNQIDAMTDSQKDAALKSYTVVRGFCFVVEDL